MLIPGSIDDAEAVIQWLVAPGDTAPPLSPAQQHMFQRWQDADRWMRDHMSVDVVAGMLMKRYDYSMATARRDIQAAQSAFGPLPNESRLYYAKLMIDKLGEAWMEAKEDRKFKECAALSRELREWISYSEELSKLDKELLQKEVPRQILFSPELLGHERNPAIMEQVREIIEQKIGKPFQMPEFPSSEADYEDVPNEPDA